MFLLGVAVAVCALVGSILFWPNAVLSWLNHLFSTYSEDDTAIFETKNLEWAKALRDNHQAIRREYEAFCESHYRPKACEVVPEEHATIVGRPSSSWRVVYLRHYLRDSDTVIGNCFPVTVGLLKGFGCVSAFFSVLEPKVALLPHTGYYKGVLRYHLGLVVPPSGKTLTGLPLCYLEVDGVKLEWEVGKDLLFDDCRMHSAFNNSDADRVVLLLDVKRPLPFVLNVVNHVAIALARFVPSSSRIVSRVNRYQAQQPQT